MKWVGMRAYCLAVVFMTACATNSVTVAPTPAAILIPAAQQTPLPSLAARNARLAAALQQPLPVLRLEGLVGDAAQAETIALQEPRFQTDLRAPGTNAPLRSEIFGVYPARPSDYTGAPACAQSRCFRVDMYNYALNLALSALVDVPAARVVAITRVPNAQPELPPALTALATEIAINAPAVQKALGFRPERADAKMASTKTALNQTRCERSRHLCVAPTFLKDNQALWAVVDLTDGVLVGIQWTVVGSTGGPVVTEKSLEDQAVNDQFCKRSNTLAQDGWELDYILTSSDGLQISNVRWKGQPVLDSAKLVDWHVAYRSRTGVGFNDGTGCPFFSSSAVLPFNGPQVEPLTDGSPGFILEQEFWSDLWPQPCNYYYEQHFEFHADGRFRIVAANVGRGCGNDGTYRPVLRIAFAGNTSVARWDGNAWQPWTTEQWALQDERVTPEGYQYRVTQSNGAGFYLEPGQGQFGDGGRGDQAFVYATRRNPAVDEGDSDLITIGSCCSEDYRQGPEQFIEPNPEPLVDTPVVLWYVPQIENDDTPGEEYCWAESVLENGVFVAKEYPCFAGPLFVPISSPK